MRSFKLFDRRHRRVYITVAMLVAAVAPSLSPVLASAAQITDRSITLSSASAGKTGVTYKVVFTATDATATAVVLNFCSDSPLIGTSCGVPGGFDAKTSAAASGWTVDSTNSTNNKLILTGGTIAAGTNTITVTGVTNPSAAGTLYARIVTYAGGGGTAATNAAGYTAADPDAVGAHSDDGGVAMSIASDIGVDAAVMETLTFCVSGGAAPGENCDTNPANVSGITAPNLTLGHDIGNGVIALDSSLVYTGTVYTQLSTNAASGAVVNIKSGNACGGLMRVGAAGCDIPATNTTNLQAGTAGIGVQVGDANGTATSGVTTAGGKLEPATSGSYGTSAYALTYTGSNTGVTRTYGDPILDTNGATVNNMNNTLQFGATASNQTPAGKYSNAYSLIATGKF